MRCHEIMKTNLATCWIYDPIRSIAARMRARDVGFLPVCNDQGEVVGTITDRDLVIRAMADQLSYDAPVHVVMSTPPIACHANDDISRVEALMRRHFKSRMLVVDDYGRPVGVISLSDIADAEFAWRAGRVFRDVTARERHAH
jgi:CBS domain-containing protein